MQRNRTGNPRRAGFTLVEVLVVLGILVLLASMVVPRIISRQRSANVDATKTQIGALRAALDHYAIDCHGYPTTDQGLIALTQQPPDLPVTAKWKGSYLTGAVPRDPWGNDYQYEYPSTYSYNDDPAIWSFGPDGPEGTADDDVCSWTENAQTATDAEMMMEEGVTRPASRAPREPGAVTPGGKRSSSAPPPIRNPQPVLIE